MVVWHDLCMIYEFRMRFWFRLYFQHVLDLWICVDEDFDIESSMG